ncbi:MAG TPA: bifunctional hydroxymethylpyrimidine kinase/phosphomethylpyrimidine kinase [Candidatus Baltobacteraceae bacterium]|jgi:hydroxymethylpyrimidine/phosphomethylpyrimidine kinase
MSAVVASIGTTHPWNIAGVGLDAHVAADYDVRHVQTIVAVSSQNAGGMRLVQAITPEAIASQLTDMPPNLDAIRVGAIVGVPAIELVAAFLQRMPSRVAIVVDPVFTATLGGSFTDESTLAAFEARIATLPVVLTPNIDEASVLLRRPVTAGNMEDAAAEILARGARAVLLTGGHLEGDPTDVLAEDGAIERFCEPRLPGNMRGTGCTLAMALACELARGRTLRAAVDSARAFVRERIAAGVRIGDLHVAF